MHAHPQKPWTYRWGVAAVCAALTFHPQFTTAADQAESDLAQVVTAQSERIESIARVAPSAVCIFDDTQRGGGSGVLIDPTGYGLTNYHVFAGMLETRKGFGGLADGVLYDLEVLGIDITGDVAMFRLLPPKPDFQFPYVSIGDSDTVRVGDTAIAIGNPFSLSEDYTPSVSVGMVSGTHRYQWGTQGNLVYTDCIQVDTAINPGNSGGPLFNINGEVIGINGRISVNTRGRYNVGFGYAISSNQIKRFMPALRAGILARHGTLLAVTEDDLSAGGTAFRSGSVRFTEVQPAGPADRAGIRSDDKLLSFDGVRIESANQVASMLGTYPVNWPVTLELERNGQRRSAVVRLEPVEPNMRGAFEVDRDINAQAVRRVLEAFQRAVLKNVDTQRPTRWSWTIERKYHPSEDGTARSDERFRVTHRDGAMGHMQQIHADGTKGRIIEYDDNEATQRIDAGDNPFPLHPTEGRILAALFTVYHSLLEPLTTIDLSPAVHGGGDAIVENPQASITTPGHETQNRRLNPRIVEVIHWFMPSGAEVRFSFDTRSFLLVRAVVEDKLSGAKATIRFSDYRDVDGIHWPCALEVATPTFNYRETLTHWELTR
jgi:S1-C subfamily serine protease